jgi:ABC-type amino acid transport substrate-binding protein
MLGLVAVTCGLGAPATLAPSTTSATATAALTSTAAAAGELDKLRARGTLIVAIRVEAPPANRAMGDPAHAQKRAFETAVAVLIATALIGPGAKVQLQSVGGDRLTALGQGADIAMVTEAPTSRDRALISLPYAANSVVVVIKDGAPIARLEELSGKSVGVAQDELVTRDLAQTFFQGRGTAVALDTYMGVNGAATALDADRAAAFVGDGIGVMFIAAERRLRVLTGVTPRPCVIAVRQDAPDVANAVNAALRGALASGAVRDAAAKASFPYTAP